MSIGYVFLKCDDGKFYRSGSLGTDDWFICFDEDEPPELVIKSTAFAGGLTPERIIKENNLDCVIVGKLKRWGGRCFEKEGSSRLLMTGAVSVFLEMFTPPSAKLIREYAAVFDEHPKCEGTYFIFRDAELRRTAHRIAYEAKLAKEFASTTPTPVFRLYDTESRRN